jgi:heme/copper-type cytochrome/quinol oxidase subunit 2
METIMCVGKRGYLVSLLVWVALKRTKKWATADLTQENKLKFILLLLVVVVVVVVVVVEVVVVIFSSWAGFGRNQNPVRRPAWLWHAAFWASS